MKKRFWFFLVLSGLVLMNGCKPERSFENGTGPSEGTLQDDGGGDCLPKTVAGAYAAGVVLDGNTNYIEVQVNVTVTGSYTITTDTVNGIYFRATGIFTTAGLNTVRLKGNGTPAVAGIHNFIVSYGTSGCSIAVTTSGSLAVFTLDGAPGGCTSAAPAGTYIAGTALTAANTVNINVNVTTTGAYNVSTSLANGMTFTGSGTFTTTGPQAIVLTGAGTPTTAGATTIPVTAGSSSCSFPVTVQAPAGAATFTVNCASAVVNGTYTVNTALGASNTVNITVDVTVAGTYSITGTIGGMTFAASGTFAATGTAVPVTLTGTGTPTTAGSNTVPLTGGTTACNFNVTVGPAAGAATFTVNCATAVANGTYTVNTALTATNTITLPVTVTTAGSYSITATLNGMTFAASGTFAATGAQNVTLNGTGTPTVAGANSVPVTAGTAPCNFTVNVNPAAGGAATFTVDCASANPNSTYTQGYPLAAQNTVTIDVNVTVPGTYTITTTATNGVTFSASGSFAATGIQTVTLAGTGTPTAAGTFNIPVPSGTTPCNFPLTIDPSFGSWSFKVGATTFSGPIYEADFDNSAAPLLIFYLLGDNPAGDDFEIDLVDITGGILANEQYNCATFTGTTNAGGVYYAGATGTAYDADPTLPTNTMVVRITSHNTTTKTIVGTFSGKALLNGGTTLVDITNGTFTATYP